MAAFEDGSAPQRKRMTTYGKAVRRRIPDYNIASSSTDSRLPKEINLDQSPDLETTSAEHTKHNTWEAPIRPAKPEPDIYDMPSSDEDPPPSKPRPAVKRMPSKPISKAKVVPANIATLPSTKVTTVKMTQRESALKSSTLTSPAASNIYDLSSSDDDLKPLTPKPIKKAPLKAEQKTSRVGAPKDGNTAVLSSIGIDPPQASKRRKLSPPHKSSIATETTSKTSPPAIIKRSNSDQDKLKKATPKRLVSRPKLNVHPSRNRDVPKFTAKPNIVSNSGPSTFSKSTSPQAISMTNNSSSSGHISPRGNKIWKDFLDSTEEENGSDVIMQDRDQPPIESIKPVSTTSLVGTGRPLFKPAGVTKRALKSPHMVPRRRLIDTLVEQATPEEYSEDEESLMSEQSEQSEAESVKKDPAKMSHDQFAEILSQTLGQDSTLQPQALPSSQASQGVGPRITYSRQRSMLAEDDLLQQLEIDMPFQTTSQDGKARRGAMPLTSLKSFQEDEEMLDLAPAVTSVHELRQAGANQRFMEEIEDLLDTIGKPTMPPSSMRRSALSELSSKLKDKTFLRQFRDNGIEQRLFLHLGQELDVIAGFYIITMLVLVLTDANVPHLVGHLRRHGITRLLIRLVSVQDGISKVGKDRKSNMSKMALGLLLEHQKSLLTLPLWGEVKPLLLSPRTVSLKCLELMVRQTREAGKADDIFSKEMTTTLFDILKSASDPSFFESPQGQQAFDFHLALSVLELHSIRAMTARDESIWISDYLPVVVNTVEVLLAQSATEFASLQYMLLRLVVNVTNNDPNASEVFAKKEVLNILGQVIIAKFMRISQDLNEDELSEALGQLVVALGVMINLAESGTVRECFNGLCGGPHDPLMPMVQLFMDNQEKMLEANTQEESQRNVAFGYLSILLGYLALSPAISERIRARQKGLTLQPLLTSIEQFISYHKAVDDILEAEEDGYSRQTGLTERLEALVERLRAMKGNVGF